MELTELFLYLAGIFGLEDGPVISIISQLVANPVGEVLWVTTDSISGVLITKYFNCHGVLLLDKKSVKVQDPGNIDHGLFLLYLGTCYCDMYSG